MPVSSEKIHSSNNDCLASRRHVQEKSNNVLYCIAAENSKLGKHYELFQLKLVSLLNRWSGSAAPVSDAPFSR
jgi:hypothetical protein